MGAGIKNNTRIVGAFFGVLERLPRLTPRNDVAGILLPTRIVGGRFFGGAWCVCGYGKGAVITKKVPNRGLFKYRLGVSL